MPIERSGGNSNAVTSVTAADSSIVIGGTATAPIIAAAVKSVFTRTGAVVAAIGDYTAAQVTNAADLSAVVGQVFTANLQATFFRATSPTNPTGYAVGAGGTVTQLTSRTTAVTLNKSCGQITTFNSSMVANAMFSFTVNNSSVSASDTVILNCTNDATSSVVLAPYVGQVAGGSFVITYANNSSGTVSTAFVFNFAIIKAVAS